VTAPALCGVCRRPLATECACPGTVTKPVRSVWDGYVAPVLRRGKVRRSIVLGHCEGCAFCRGEVTS
jgi:hypothetical protein